MFMVVDFALLVGIIALLIETERPLLCAAVFTGCKLLLSFLGEIDLSVLALGGAITFGFMFAWLWLLNRIETARDTWWLALAGGVVGGFVLGVI